MKKFIPIILVLAMCLPALADVTVTAADQTGGVLRVTVSATGDAVVRGYALKLTVETGDAVVDGVDDISMGAMTNTDLKYAHIDYYFSNPAFLGGLADPSLLPGSGAHALANPADPGVLDLSSAKTVFSVCTGILNDGETQAGLYQADSFFDITYTLSANSTIQIEADALRGGIVGNNLGTVTIVNGNGNEATLAPAGPPPCKDRLPLTPDQAEYTRYINAGKTTAQMDCWCWRFQCKGDADNVAYLPGTLDWQIYQSDLNILIGNWKKKYSAADINPCADFDHQAYLPGTLDWNVYQGDLNILIANWKKKPTAMTDCPGYVAP